MKDFILLMHSDATVPEDAQMWDRYFQTLHQSGQFDGGSSIGEGQSRRKGRSAEQAALPLVGFIRVRARDMNEAAGFLAGNPVYESGGTIEIRELPRD